MSKGKNYYIAVHTHNFCLDQMMASSYDGLDLPRYLTSLLQFQMLSFQILPSSSAQ